MIFFVRGDRFGTQENLKILCEVDTVYVDGQHIIFSTIRYFLFMVSKNGKQFPTCVCSSSITSKQANLLGCLGVTCQLFKRFCHPSK